MTKFWPPIAETEEELDSLIAHHLGTITGTVTPQFGQWSLARNPRNRPLIDPGSDRFAQIATEGRWLLTGEPIIFSASGYLSDGQHRLAGIVRAGVSVVMDVRFGVREDAFQCTGTSRRRTAAQTLQILNVPYASTASSMGRLLHLHAAGMLERRDIHTETPDVARAIEQNPNTLPIAKFIHNSKFTPIRTAGFGFPLVLAARVAPLDTVLLFAGLVASGLTDTPNNAARALHLRLLDATLKKERLLQIEVAALVVRGWNAWIEGREVRQLKVLSADRMQGGFPEVLGPPSPEPAP